MRSLQVACAAAILALVTAGSAAAKDAATAIPNNLTLASMSSDELRAFLAGPALNIDNVLRLTSSTAASDSPVSCPAVKNEGRPQGGGTNTPAQGNRPR